MKQVPRNIASRKNYFVEVLAYLYKTQCVTFVLTKQQITLLRKEGVSFQTRMQNVLDIIQFRFRHRCLALFKGNKKPYCTSLFSYFSSFKNKFYYGYFNNVKSCSYSLKYNTLNERAFKTGDN